MLKKSIPLIFMSVMALQAATISTDKEVYTTGEKIKVHISDMQGQNRDWVAIYPKEANNEWKNVLRWSWTNDVSSGDISFKGLSKGSYQARVFYNNSYKVEARDDFSIKAAQHNATVSTSKDIYEKGQKITVNLKGMSGNKKDWIGIYPKDANNEWKNVLRWSWSGGVIDGSITLKGIVKSGNYQVRAFFNNSYNLEASSDFSINGELSKIYLSSDMWYGSIADLWVKTKKNVNYAHVQYFINSDLNKNTGFKSTRMNLSGIEYLIEDRKIYKYTGDGKNWKWSYVSSGSLPRYDSELHGQNYDEKTIVRIFPSSIGIKSDNSEKCKEINDNGGYCDWYDYTLDADVDVMLWDSSWKIQKIFTTQRLSSYGGVPGI